MRKLLSVVVVLFVGYYLMTRPGSAAGFVHQALDLSRQAAEGLSAFVTSL